jgi:hypothetical protein
MNGIRPIQNPLTSLVAMMACLALGTVAPAGAQTIWHVPDDPGAATIAEALASAVAGDSILIAPGTYFEHDLVMTEGVLLRSELNDPHSVIIDAASQGRVMIGIDLTSATAIVGVTLTGGLASGGDPDGLGGAMFLLRSSPDIGDCVIQANAADYGGGLYLRDLSDPVVTNCRFVANESASAGGGVFCHLNAAPLFSLCTFAANTAFGLGGGLFASSGSHPSLEQCTFADNEALLGAAMSSWSDSPASVAGVLIAENLAGWAVEGDLNSTATFSCCDIFGNEGGDWQGPLADQVGSEGNFSADPFFCRESASLSPYSLAEDSPCVDAPGGCGQVGAWGVGCGAVVGVPGIPIASRLHPSHPNPFNPATVIRFDLVRDGPVALQIYAVDGRLIATLIDEPLPAGAHQRTWDGTDRNGRRVASGVYFCRLVAGPDRQTQRMALVK